MVVLACPVQWLAAQSDEVALVQLQVSPAESYTIVKREDVVHLDGSELVPVWFATNALGLASKMLFDHFGPMATPLDFKRQCNSGAVVDVDCRFWLQLGRSLDRKRLIWCLCFLHALSSEREGAKLRNLVNGHFLGNY